MASSAFLVSSVLTSLISSQISTNITQKCLNKLIRVNVAMIARSYSSKEASSSQTNLDHSCPHLLKAFKTCDITKTSNTKTPSSSKLIKSFDSIPRPKGLPLIGTTLKVLIKGGASRVHEYCNYMHCKLGPIFCEKFGPVSCIFLADSNMVSQVYQNEGKYPNHLVPEAWLIYNKINGIQRGLFFMDGEQWSERRKELNKLFLNQQVISEYTEVFNKVVIDLLTRWVKISDKFQGPSNNLSNSKKYILKKLEKELYGWSIESLGTMIFGRRLGYVSAVGDDLDSEKMNEVHNFVHCVQQLFVESAKMTLIPPELAYRLNLPVWKRFCEAADGALHLAENYVKVNLEAMKNQKSNLPAQGILQKLMNQKNIDQDEVIRIVVDLFLAAADTTSHATQWALYLLAKNPQCQEKLLAEVNEVVGKNGYVQEKHLKSFHYVKGIIKESLRLYPVAPFLNRRLDHDIVLGGYHIPAGELILISLYTLGRDEKNFQDANSFKPERWIRNDCCREVINTHACLPFGLGIRSCIGRRVAEMQMQLLLARVIQKYKLFPGNKNDVGIKLRMITTPEEPIHLVLEAR